MEILEKLYRGENLSRVEMSQVAKNMFSGKLTDVQLSALFIALKIKGETKEELTGLSETMRSIAIDIPYTAGGAMCNCGTGGDRSNSFNISTTSAFVLAAGGVKMAKTGNRSISSKSGGFDLCEELGIDFMKSPSSLAELLNKVGIAFIFAPNVHLNMKYVGKVRKELATPTIMNLIGPIANPVQLDYQLMGTFRKDLVSATAETLANMGRKKAVVVHGANGMDEASLSGENYLTIYEDGKFKNLVLTPEDVSLPRYQIEDIRGGDAKANAAIFNRVISGEKSPYYDTVLLNSGLGLYTANVTTTIQEGIQYADQLLQSGQVKNKVAQLLKAQKEVE